MMRGGGGPSLGPISQAQHVQLMPAQTMRCIVCKKWLSSPVRMSCACGFSWCPSHTLAEVEPVLERLHKSG